MKTEKLVKIKVSRKTIDHYLDKGYRNILINDYIDVKSKDVYECVSTRIYVMCERCNRERYIISSNYHMQIKKSGYYVCNKCSMIKVKDTNIKKYGTICPLQNKNIAKKSEESLLEKYGVDNISKLESIKNSRRDNFKTDNFKNKSKKTWIDKYGVDNPSKSIVIKNKKIDTTLKNYGVENPSQSYEIFEKSQKSGKKIKEHECGLMYRGTYEKDFLDYCYRNSIKVEKGPTIGYYYNNKKRYYHSDFYIPLFNMICEIKSSYYYDLYKNINIAKMSSSMEKGYLFLFIINKDYKDMEMYMKSFI